MVEFRDLQLYFKATQERFRKAKTLEERRELLAISREIIEEARRQIAGRRAQMSSSIRFIPRSEY